MSDDFEKLKAKLAESSTLSDEEIAAATLTDEQKIWLNAERYTQQRQKAGTVTMEQYLAASKVLDTAPADSPEYLEAEKIVKKYEDSL